MGSLFPAVPETPPQPSEDMSSPGRFRTTHWSLVLRAADGSDAMSEAALERLCRTYWPAVHAFLLRRGHSPADAQDLTQGFFARLLEKEWLRSADATKGRFRTFLLTALTRFLSKERDRQQTQKRGGGQILFSLDAGELEAQWVPEPSDPVSPDALFERKWAESLLNLVMERLRMEFDGGGRAGRFAELKSFLTDDRGEQSYAEVAARLGVSEPAVKSGIHRLRRRYAELIREEIANTVEDPAQIDEEIRHLLAALGS